MNSGSGSAGAPVYFHLHKLSFYARRESGVRPDWCLYRSWERREEAVNELPSSVAISCRTYLEFHPSFWLSFFLLALFPQAQVSRVLLTRRSIWSFSSSDSSSRKIWNWQDRDSRIGEHLTFNIKKFLQKITVLTTNIDGPILLYFLHMNRLHIDNNNG